MFISLIILGYWYINKLHYKMIFFIFVALNFSILPILTFQDPYSITKNSFSQWKNYSPLLHGDEYCIPINPFPWSMQYNCKTLYLEETAKIRKSIDLSQYTTISAVVLIKPQISPFGYEPDLVLLNQDNIEIGKGKRLTDLHNDFIYYKFNTKNITSKATTIIFRNEDKEKLSILSGVIIYGK